MKFFTFILACILSAQLFAQSDVYVDSTNTPSRPSKSTWMPGVNAEGKTAITYGFSIGFNQLHEVRVERFFKDKWSLLYSGGYAYQGPSGYYPASEQINEIRAPLGLSLAAASVVVIGYSAYSGCYYGDGLLDMFVLLSMIPDGIAYHIPINNRIDISPFVMPFGMSYQWTNNNNNSSLQYSPMAGCRVLIPMGRSFMFTAEQNFRRMSSDSPLVTSTGLGISVVF